MRRWSVMRRVLAVAMSVVMAIALLPAGGVGGKAQAATDDTWTKTVAGIGTTVIKAPKAPTNPDDEWTGSYVWYGRYNSQPVRYRVLAPKTTLYGGTTMLLDCDTILYRAAYDSDGKPNQGAEHCNEWA